MEQCVFVGYPSGYKGWKFYSTKKYIISERAPVDLTSPNIVPLLPDTTPDLLLNLEGDGDVDDCTTATLPPVPVPELPLAPLAPLDPPPVDLPLPQLPVLPPVPPHVPEPPHRTQRVSRPPGEWWKIKHPEAVPPVIYLV